MGGFGRWVGELFRKSVEIGFVFRDLDVPVFYVVSGGVYRQFWLILRGKMGGRTAKEVEGVVEPVFVGFRVNSFEPFGDIGGEFWDSFVVMFDVAKDEII